MKSSTGDLSSYSKHIAECLIGISGIYVDDIIEAGNPDFQIFTKLTAERFCSKDRIMRDAKFMGMHVSQS